MGKKSENNKTVYTKVVETVDTETGELMNSDTVIIQIPVKRRLTNEEFSMIFGKILSSILNLEGNDVKVFMWCAMNAKFNENTVHLDRDAKLAISEQTGISFDSIKNSITKLVKHECLITTDRRGYYRVNPDLSWKGKMSKRDEQIQKSISINFVEH